MADPFVAEVRIFPFNFAPKGWAWCDNQLLPISQNTALFSLLGTMYGGDGKSNFALPGFEGSAVVHAGQGPGLSQYFEGQVGGSQTVTLLDSEMPSHPHPWNASNADSNGQSPSNQLMAGDVGGITNFAAPSSMVQLNPNAVAPAGGNQPHNNMMPYLTLYFNIALQGVFPPRT